MKNNSKVNVEEILKELSKWKKKITKCNWFVCILIFNVQLLFTPLYTPKTKINKNTKITSSKYVTRIKNNTKPWKVMKNA